MIVSTVSEIGIIFPGERSELVRMLSERLKFLGYFDRSADIFSSELIAALDRWRIDNSLPMLDYADPLSLRLIGLEVGGDELILLARHAEQLKTESERFEFCRSAIYSAHELNMSLVEYLARHPPTKLPLASTDALRSAVIASLMSN